MKQLELKGPGEVVMRFPVLETQLQYGARKGLFTLWHPFPCTELFRPASEWLMQTLQPRAWNALQQSTEEPARTVTRRVYKVGVECVWSTGDASDRYKVGTLQWKQHRALCWRMKGIPLDPVTVDDVTRGEVMGVAARLIQP